jgi:uncharacterized protein (TIGR03083 family)
MRCSVVRAARRGAQGGVAEAAALTGLARARVTGYPRSPVRYYPADMRLAEPVLVGDLLPEIRRLLLELLEELTGAEWDAPTPCPDWTVKDIALHLLGDDIGILSRRRDGFLLPPLPGEDIVMLVNRLNDTWLRATSRLSPRVLCDLLRHTGDQVDAYFATLDPFQPAEPVSWAGPEPAPAWLGIAREYTEHWVHQQQIREGLGVPGLFEPRLFAPVLATFVRALPHTFHRVIAPVGTIVVLTVEGESGGQWAVLRSTNGAWELYEGPVGGRVAARVTLDQDIAWRMFTRAVAPAVLRRRAAIRGDRSLGETILRSVAIIA